MKREKLFIFGASDFSSVVADYVVDEGTFEFCGFLVDDEFAPDEKNSHSHPLLSLSSAAKFLAEKNTKLISTIGYQSMRERAKVFRRLSSLDVEFTNIVSSDAKVHDSITIGINNIVFPGVVVEPNVDIGSNNVFWSNSTMCHDTRIGDHNFFAANCVVGGNCKVGNESFFGFSSVVYHNTVVQNGTLLGALSGLKHCGFPDAKYLGNPADLVSRHEKTGIRIS